MQDDARETYIGSLAAREKRCCARKVFVGCLSASDMSDGFDPAQTLRMSSAGRCGGVAS
jgi:hypothetical protein